MSVTQLYHDIELARASCKLIMNGKDTYELMIQRLGKRRNAFVRSPDDIVKILEPIKPESYNVIWLRLNPLNRDPAPLADAQKAEEKLPNSSATSDDVTRCQFVQVDFDAIKPDGMNDYASTDTEHAETHKARDRYHSHALTMYDIEPAYIGDTGNGGVLLYRVDLPNTPQNTKLIKDAFRAIAESAGVKIDTATLEPARFMGLPGTINRGKEAAEDRPHRLRTGEVYPDAPIVSAAILETLQAEYRPLHSPESQPQEHTDDSELTDSERDELISIISEGWKDGNRHNYGLAVSGLLFHMGVKLEQAKSIIETLSTKAGDTDTDDRLEACERTYERGIAGETVAWYETLEETLSQSSMHAIGKLRAGIRDRSGEIDPDWQEPIPLDDPTGPAFDTDLLPGQLGQFVRDTATSLQTPPDVPAIMSLATISAASGGRYQVSIKELKWYEPVHIHTFVSQPPGSRKSPTERALTWPVNEYENEVNPGERQAITNWESLERVKKKALSEAEGRAGKATDDGKITNAEALRMAAVEDLSSHQERKPRLTRIRIDDATAEAATSLAAENGGAIGVLSAESAILDRLALNPYGDSPNLEPLLKGHAGDHYKIDRKNRPAETIERFCMTVGVMVQPSLIPKLGAVPGFIDRGAAARFLPSFPVDIVGTRLINTTPVPDHLEYEYGETIKRILRRVPSIKNGSYEPWAITLDSEAFVRLEEYRHWHEPELRPSGAFGDLRDWAAKLPGQILRIAALLHIYQHSEPEAVGISLDTLNRAISIGEYFTAHARIMYQMMSHETGHETARTVWAALVEDGEMSVNRRDLHIKLRGRRAFRRAADLDGPLSILEEFGYIRLRKITRKDGGRPAEWIDLNPLAMQAERSSPPVVRFTSSTVQDLAPTGTDGFVPRFVEEI